MQQGSAISVCINEANNGSGVPSYMKEVIFELEVALQKLTQAQNPVRLEVDVGVDVDVDVGVDVGVGVGGGGGVLRRGWLVLKTERSFWLMERLPFVPHP